MTWEEGWGMGWWMLFSGVLWVVFIVAVVYLVTSAAGGGGRTSAGGSDSALDIARARLASGEISQEEYERLRGTLAR